MTQDEREAIAEWKRLDHNAAIQREHDIADGLEPIDLSWPEWDFTGGQELPEDYNC